MLLPSSEQVFYALIALLVVLAPGLCAVAVAALGTRWATGSWRRLSLTPLLAGAPAAAYGFTGLITLLCTADGVRWQFSTAAVGTLILIIALCLPGLVWIALRRTQPAAPPAPAPRAPGVVVAPDGSLAPASAPSSTTADCLDAQEASLSTDLHGAADPSLPHAVSHTIVADEPSEEGESAGTARSRFHRITDRVATPATIALVLLSGLLSSATCLRGIGSAEAIVPNWDAFFHGAAIRWIAEHGTACPTCLGAVIQPNNPDAYYPTGYHAMAALLLSTPDATMPVSYSSFIGITGFLFTVGCAALAWACGLGRAGACVAAVIATVIPAYPAELVSYGQLGPFGMSVALVPGAVAAVISQLRRPSLWSIPVVVPALIGVVVLHPSAALFVCSAAALYGLVALVRAVAASARRRGAAARRGGASRGQAQAHPRPGAGEARPHSPWLAVTWGVVTAAVAAAGTLLLVDTGASESMTTDWPAVDSVWNSVVTVVFLGDATQATRVVVLTLASFGLVAVLVSPRLRGWALPTVLVGAVALAGAVAARGSDEDWVNSITSLWWNDWRRLAALGALAFPLLAACGTHWLVHGLRGGALHPARWGAALTAVSVLIALPAQEGLADRAGRDFAPAGSEEAIVTGLENEAYRWLAEHYGGGTVLNDPFDGSAWLYSLYSVPTVFPVPLDTTPQASFGADRMLLFNYAHDAGDRSKERVLTTGRAIERLDVQWVLVSEKTWVGQRDAPPGGYLNLLESPGFDLAFRNGDVTIYKVDREQISATLTNPGPNPVTDWSGDDETGQDELWFSTEDSPQGMNSLAGWQSP